MTFKFILTHEIEGQIEMSTPGGWAKAVLSLNRDPKFHSVLKSFKSAFSAYGSNGVQDGKRDWLKNIEDAYGPEAIIVIEVLVTDDDINYFTMFKGQVAINLFVERLNTSHLLDLSFTNDDFWTKFIARQDTPVNLQDTKSQDNTDVSVQPPLTIQLPSQQIQYKGEYKWGGPTTYYSIDGTGPYMQLDWDEEIIDDLQKFTVPRQRYDDTITSVPSVEFPKLFPNFEAPADGKYKIQGRIEAASGQFIIAGDPDSVWSTFVTPFAVLVGKYKSTTPFRFNAVSHVGTEGRGNWSSVDFECEINLIKGEQVTIAGALGGPDLTIFGSRLNNWKPLIKAYSDITQDLGPGTPVIDGYNTVDGDFVLLGNQGDPSQNGVWVVKELVPWFRPASLDTGAELNYSAFFIENGDVYANACFECITLDAVVGLDAIEFRSMPDNLTRLVQYPAAGIPNTYLNVTALTTYRRTTAECFLMHDVAAQIMNRIAGREGLMYSEYIGGLLTTRSYPINGKQWDYVLTRGLQLRQYSLLEKPFFISFKDWWEGADPIFNLGLGIDKIDGLDVIRIEDKAHFYNEEMSIAFLNVKNIERDYDEDLFFNNIKTGYKTWQSEDVNGINDVQTVHTRSSILTKIGKPIELLSSWIGAALAAESTRRQTRAKSSDYKFDENVFIVNVTSDLTPAIDEEFTEVTNVTGEDTRYNKKLTPGRNFLRWLNFLSMGLQKYTASVFKFTGGEGNYDMTSTMVDNGEPECFGGASFSESQDIPVGEDYLFYPIAYKIEHYVTFKEALVILNNLHKAIGISLSDGNPVPFFIKTLDYTIAEGKVSFTGWPKKPFSINKEDINQTPPSTYIFDSSFAHDDTGNFE